MSNKKVSKKGTAPKKPLIAPLAKEDRYPAIVYQRLRHILMGYRNQWTGKRGAEYDWGELAADIAAFSDINFPKNSLENFVRGLEQEDKSQPVDSPDRRKLKISKPGPDRIDAMIEYLTDKKSSGWFCDRSVLLAAVEPQLPYFLQEHLSQPDDSIPEGLLAKRLAGHYRCHVEIPLSTARTDRFAWELYAIAPLYPSVVAIDLLRSEGAPDAIDSSLLEYVGWAVATREGSLHVYLQHYRTQQNLFFQALSMDGIVNTSSTPPQAMVLLEHQLVDDNITLDDTVDTTVMREQTEEEVLRALRTFARQEDWEYG